MSSFLRKSVFQFVKHDGLPQLPRGVAGKIVRQRVLRRSISSFRIVDAKSGTISALNISRGWTTSTTRLDFSNHIGRIRFSTGWIRSTTHNNFIGSTAYAAMDPEIEDLDVMIESWKSMRRERLLNEKSLDSIEESEMKIMQGTWEEYEWDYHLQDEQDVADSNDLTAEAAAMDLPGRTTRRKFRDDYKMKFVESMLERQIIEKWECMLEESEPKRAKEKVLAKVNILRGRTKANIFDRIGSGRALKDRNWNAATKVYEADKTNEGISTRIIRKISGSIKGTVMGKNFGKFKSTDSTDTTEYYSRTPSTQSSLSLREFNTMLDFYEKSGRTEEAWDLYNNKMPARNMVPNIQTITVLMSVSTPEKALDLLYRDARQVNNFGNYYALQDFYTALLAVLVKSDSTRSGLPGEAEHFNQVEHFNQALRILRYEMPKHRVQGNRRTFVTLISNCSKRGDYQEALALLREDMVEHDQLPDLKILNLCIMACTKACSTSACSTLAVQQFEKSSGEAAEEEEDFFNSLSGEDCSQTNCIISPLNAALQILEEDIPSLGLIPDRVSKRVVVEAAMKSKCATYPCGRVDVALKLFREIDADPYPVNWEKNQNVDFPNPLDLHRLSTEMAIVVLYDALLRSTPSLQRNVGPETVGGVNSGTKNRTENRSKVECDNRKAENTQVPYYNYTPAKEKHYTGQKQRGKDLYIVTGKGKALRKEIPFRLRESLGIELDFTIKGNSGVYYIPFAEIERAKNTNFLRELERI